MAVTQTQINVSAVSCSLPPRHVRGKDKVICIKEVELLRQTLDQGKKTTTECYLLCQSVRTGQLKMFAVVHVLILIG